MIRLLLIAAVLYLVWRLLSGRPLWPRRPPADTPADPSLVRCRHCGLFLPETRAIAADGHHYCCPEHRDAESR